MQFIESTVLILMCSLMSTKVDAQDCGKRNFNPTLITGGQDAVRGEFPWVAALYRLMDGKYKYYCGATLIRTNIVVTGAVCVLSLPDGKTLNDVTEYKVALGKHHREYDEDSANSGVQFVDVDSFVVPKRYRGQKRNFENDIAVVKLASHVRLTRAVNVACVEFNVCSEESVFSSGAKGTVAGWGNTNQTEGPVTLQWLDMPRIDDDQCWDETSPRHQKHLTLDKFCAGYANQTKGLCLGDSSDGYVVLKNGRYYLKGVAGTALSSGPSWNFCFAEFYMTFTSVDFHSDWLKRAIGEQDTLS